jgi:hypothetical protein
LGGLHAASPLLPRLEERLALSTCNADEEPRGGVAGLPPSGRSPPPVGRTARPLTQLPRQPQPVNRLFHTGPPKGRPLSEFGNRLGGDAAATPTARPGPTLRPSQRLSAPRRHAGRQLDALGRSPVSRSPTGSARRRAAGRSARAAPAGHRGDAHAGSSRRPSRVPAGPSPSMCAAASTPTPTPERCPRATRRSSGSPPVPGRRRSAFESGAARRAAPADENDGSRPATHPRSRLRRQLLPVDDRRRRIRLLEEQPAATDEPRVVLDLEPLRIPEPLLLEEVLVERRVRRGARRSRLVALVLVRDN